MRIVIDLQACQTSGSRTRGIGRYSMALAQAMARHAGQHELWLLLSGLFPETIAPIRAEFADLIPAGRIRVWSSAAPTAEHNPANAWRRRSAEIVREQALAELRPDIVHVASLFEGFSDDGVTSVSAARDHLQTAVTLYDLIPLVHADPYLENSQVRAWYYRKLNALKSADLLLSISEASRLEGLERLHLPEDRIVNISSAVDARFKRQTYNPAELAQVKRSHGLTRPFVMYTGGIDLRKNIEGLIRAYAALPVSLRSQYQLAVVCSARPEDKERLHKLAQRSGLGPDELVMTGFVPDEELPMLYNDCALFVFPSWHEGFGLPALEAMACGAPVIGANTSSLPEVIGHADAMFDPRSDAAITAKLHQALTDAAFRDLLRAHGAQQAQKFSWDASGKKALAALEEQHVRSARQVSVPGVDRLPQRKPKLAFVAPLPPTRSGIADYSAELLPELARYYDIELVVNQPAVEDDWLTANYPVRDWHWFDAHADRFDRILYQVGNSAFHGYMFELLKRHPGVVVMHDFFLSGALAHLEFHGEFPGIWTQALYNSHGYAALIDKRRQEADATATIMQYPCNAALINKADGIIVHAQYSIRLAQQWYGEKAAEDWCMIPHLRRLPAQVNRETTREKLGLASDDFLVCSFGLLGPTKLNDRLLQAWLNSPLANDPRCRLVFVGENHSGAYGMELVKTIKSSGCADRITITGFADPELFRTYLAAADAAVQLRTLSRGETSGTVLDCMAHGIPTIVNAHAVMAELSERAVIKLPDVFTNEALTAKLVELREQPQQRKSIGKLAVERIRSHHAPAEIGRRYFQAIEAFAQMGPPARRRRAIAAIAAIEEPQAAAETDWFGIAAGLAGIYNTIHTKQILLDVTELVQSDLPKDEHMDLQDKVREFITAPRAGCRVEPVVAVDGAFRYARKFTCDLLGIPPWAGSDDAIEAHVGDVFIELSAGRSAMESSGALAALEAAGVKHGPSLREMAAHEWKVHDAIIQ
jgi:glycosyltransferase involved in cell wall biosynthesis